MDRCGLIVGAVIQQGRKLSRPALALLLCPNVVVISDVGSSGPSSCGVCFSPCLLGTQLTSSSLSMLSSEEYSIHPPLVGGMDNMKGCLLHADGSDKRP